LATSGIQCKKKLSNKTKKEFNMIKENNRIGRNELSAAIGRAVELEKARIELLQACQVDEVGGGLAEDVSEVVERILAELSLPLPPFPPVTAGYHQVPRPLPFSGVLPE
jgi:tellurite resistance protein